MSLYNSDEFSDDEIFIGPLTLKDVKKIFKIRDKKPQTIPTITVTSPKNSVDDNESLKILQAHSQPSLLPETQNSDHVLSELKNSPGLDKKLADENNEKEEDIKLMTEFKNIPNLLDVTQQNSKENNEKEVNVKLMTEFINEPNLSDFTQQNSKENNEKEDNVKLMTEFINEPNLSDFTQQNSKENNEKEVNVKLMTEFINKPNLSDFTQQNSKENNEKEDNSKLMTEFINEPNLSDFTQQNSKENNEKENNEKEDNGKLMTEFINEPNLSDFTQQISDREMEMFEALRRYSSSYKTPQNNSVITYHQLYNYTLATPVSVKEKLFKTPLQLVSQKKPYSPLWSLIDTPSPSNIYEHIISSVTSYLENSPIATLVKDQIKPLPGTPAIPKLVKDKIKPLPGTPAIPKLVKDKIKPLPGTSAIPKLVLRAKRKENVKLPSVAYKSAKNTRVIDVQDQQKLPQSHRVKNSTTSLKRPLAKEHDHREFNFAKKKRMPQQEDTFADL